jgi:hypothetical protein
VDSEDKGPHVLTLEVLSFGFIIWLITCGIAFVVFLCENITRLIQVKIKIYPFRETEEPSAAGLSIWDDNLVVEGDRVAEVVVVTERVRIHEEVEVHVEEMVTDFQVDDADDESTAVAVAKVYTDAVQEIAPAQPSLDDEELFVKSSEHLSGQKPSALAGHDEKLTVVDLDV